MNEKSTNHTQTERISSANLAAIIVDALIDAKIVSKNDSVSAIKIVEEEIDARKAVKDY